MTKRCRTQAVKRFGEKGGLQKTLGTKRRLTDARRPNLETLYCHSSVIQRRRRYDRSIRSLYISRRSPIMDCYCMRAVPNVPRSSEEVVQGAGRGRPAQERREVPTSVASCILDRHGSCRTHSDGLSLDFSLQSPMRCSLEDVLCTAEQSSLGRGSSITVALWASSWGRRRRAI